MAKKSNPLATFGKTPTRRTCGQMIMHNALLEAQPSYRRNMMRLERATANQMSRAIAPRTQCYQIQVVIHVLYKHAMENIAESQINSQIATLNKDFRLKNPDRKNIPKVWAGLAGDPMIEYSLATKDPNGNQTNGITRTQTTRTAFPPDDSMKRTSSGGQDPWDTSKYLNIWVCRLSNSLLGYAQFPGGPKSTDGVVVLNTAFGSGGIASSPFNLGRTTTHEIGHYLNLRHIWGDVDGCSGSDFVNDTPGAETANYGSPLFPHVSCNNGPNGDMFMNYMDYVDDNAMFMFTQGQIARMHATLDGPRSGLLG